MIKNYILGIIIFCGIFGCGQEKRPDMPASDVQHTKDSFQPEKRKEYDLKQIPHIADELIKLLKQKEFEKISAYVHPKAGLRFSPYGYVNLAEDQVWKKEEVKFFASDTSHHQWGHYDGSGDVILLNTQEYYKKFIYDKDFASAPNIALDSILNAGNSLLNFKEAYPDCHFVEYYFPGTDPRYGGMDWKTLRLFFKIEGDKIYLVGIVHDQWTI